MFFTPSALFRKKHIWFIMKYIIFLNKSRLEFFQTEMGNIMFVKTGLPNWPKWAFTANNFTNNNNNKCFIVVVVVFYSELPKSLHANAPNVKFTLKISWRSHWQIPLRFSMFYFPFNVHILRHFFFSAYLAFQSLQSFCAKTEIGLLWETMRARCFPHTQAKYQQLLKFPKAQHSNTESTGTQKVKHHNGEKALCQCCYHPC